MEQEMIQPEWSKVAEVELIYKITVRASERPLIRSSRNGYETFLKIWNEDRMEFQEEFKVLFLNAANSVIGIYQASTGGLTATVVAPRLILATALKSLEVAIINPTIIQAAI